VDRDGRCWTLHIDSQTGGCRTSSEIVPVRRRRSFNHQTSPDPASMVHPCIEQSGAAIRVSASRTTQPRAVDARAHVPASRDLEHAQQACSIGLQFGSNADSMRFYFPLMHLAVIYRDDRGLDCRRLPVGGLLGQWVTETGILFAKPCPKRRLLCIIQRISIAKYLSIFEKRQTLARAETSPLSSHWQRRSTA
jgi:hypothetical protein